MHAFELSDEKETVRTLERELEKCKAEKEEALIRLSRIVSLQVRDNNPNIVDLSDKFRPEQLAEMSNNLFDDEWMDALDDLQDHLTEKERVGLLLDIVMRCFTFCNLLAKEQLDFVNRWMIPESDDGALRTTMKTLKDSRKQKALDSLPAVERILGYIMRTNEFRNRTACLS